jgi:hypothetical protein
MKFGHAVLIAAGAAVRERGIETGRKKKGVKGGEALSGTP